MCGRVIALTSYRGGIGRTMAVANLAWMLASAGSHVLVVDWNFSAPRLAEFFHPFWPGSDPRMASGVIDALWEHVLVAYRGAFDCHSPITSNDSLTAKAVPLSWSFPCGGGIDYLNVGLPDSYQIRTKLFPWAVFFERLGGRNFVERTRRAFQERYDYTIVDAPRLPEDYGGVCTMGLPDIVGVCFTPFGNEPAVASQIFHRVQETTHELPLDRKLRIVPIAMRTDNREMKLLSEARTRIQDAFKPLASQIGANTHGHIHVEVPHIPFFIYKQALAFFYDSSSHGLRNAYEEVLRFMIGEYESSSSHSTIGQIDRVRTLYESPPTPFPSPVGRSFFDPNPELRPSRVNRGHLFVSYKRGEFNRVALTIDQMQKMGFEVWWDEGIEGGAEWQDVIKRKIQNSVAVVLFISKQASLSPWVLAEVAEARRLNTPILPIKLDDPPPTSELGKLLEKVQFILDPGALPSRELEIALRRLNLRSNVSQNT